ncbi:hypothetical protein NL526_30185, partial [Klebsiella pneumoniae]|nr:hypothetical protein [Klebsiella pneumoniae]
TRYGKTAHQDHDQRDDRRKDRTLDEVVEHGDGPAALGDPRGERERRHEQLCSGHHFLGTAGAAAAELSPVDAATDALAT